MGRRGELRIRDEVVLGEAPRRNVGVRRRRVVRRYHAGQPQDDRA